MLANPDQRPATRPGPGHRPDPAPRRPGPRTDHRPRRSTGHGMGRPRRRGRGTGRHRVGQRRPGIRHRPRPGAVLATGRAIHRPGDVVPELPRPGGNAADRGRIRVADQRRHRRERDQHRPDHEHPPSPHPGSATGRVDRLRARDGPGVRHQYHHTAGRRRGRGRPPADRDRERQHHHRRTAPPPRGPPSHHPRPRRGSRPAPHRPHRPDNDPVGRGRRHGRVEGPGPGPTGRCDLGSSNSVGRHRENPRRHPHPRRETSRLHHRRLPKPARRDDTPRTRTA